MSAVDRRVVNNAELLFSHSARNGAHMNHAYWSFCFATIKNSPLYIYELFSCVINLLISFAAFNESCYLYCIWMANFSWHKFHYKRTSVGKRLLHYLHCHLLSLWMLFLSVCNMWSATIWKGVGHCLEGDSSSCMRTSGTRAVSFGGFLCSWRYVHIWINMTWFNNLVKLCFSSPKITCLDNFVLRRKTSSIMRRLSRLTPAGCIFFPIHSNNKELLHSVDGKKYASHRNESTELAHYWGSLPSEDETV